MGRGDDISLYQLPKRQLEKIERRLDYDKMQGMGSNGGSAKPKGLAHVQAVVDAHRLQQRKEKVEKEEQAAKKRLKDKGLEMHSPEEVAALPLLKPFKLKSGPESPIVATLINEQHTAEHIMGLINTEEQLMKELEKRRRALDLEEKKNEKALVKAGGKKVKKANKNKDKNWKEDPKMIEIESNIETVRLQMGQQRELLGNFSGWTRTMIQAEYSKLCATMKEDSDEYEELEMAFNFLCPQVRDPETGADAFSHEQRIAYVRELVPVLKKVTEGAVELIKEENTEAKEATAAAWGRPFASNVVQLPYVKKFQCDELDGPIVEALIEEMYQLAIAEGVRARLEKQASDPAKFKVLRHVEDELDRREMVSSELIRKHYRKRSIKLHPDRNGEHMRPIFEEFTDARNVLSDVALRQSYLRGMLSIAAGELGNLEASHEIWNQKNRPDKAEGDVRSRRSREKEVGEEKTLQLEGGLHQQIPKGAVIHHRRDGKRNHVVSVSVLVLKPIHEFYSRVRSVRVEMKSAENTKHVVKLSRAEIVANIRVDRQGPILANEIPVCEHSLNPGNWEIFWQATLDNVGTDPLNPQNASDAEVTTRPSAISSFYVADQVAKKHEQDLALAEHQCKVVRGDLSNTLQKLRTNRVDSASMCTPARFGHYHQVLVRARQRCHNLGRLMQITGKESDVYYDLTHLLTESRQVFAELEEKADAAQKRKEKKDAVKMFKAYIAHQLESDDPVSWMKEVSEAELYRQGGDVNRLYQLFIEGKGKYTLLVDSEMYQAASLREDIFTAKQCKDLAKRGEEVAAQEVKEQEEAAAAEEKRKEEEAKRERMQKEAALREKWAFVGQNATIKGLTSEKGKEMNHKLCKVMYYVVEKDRFEVQLYHSEEKAYLKRENLIAYYGHIPKKPQTKQPAPKRKAVVASMPPPSAPATKAGAWNCNKCTFENDDASTSCSMCTAPKAKPTQPKPVVELEDEKKEAEEETVPQKTPSAPSNPEAAGAGKKTIYVRSSCTKKLTGKRGRKKKDLMVKSGTDDIQIETAPIGNHVPVHLTGSRVAVLKAIALIQETIGIDNVTEKINKPAPSPTSTVSTSSVVSPPAAKAKAPAPVASAPVAPAPVAPAPVAPPGLGPFAPKSAEKKKPAAAAAATSILPPGIFTGFDKPADPLAIGIKQVVSATESETLPASHYSFGDALLPRGLMDTSQSTAPSNSLPPELPSEIGINSQGMTKESITEASISSFNDRSSGSKAYSHFTPNENDPLLLFLRSQSACIKGSVEDFFVWLVKSEDIDSMSALKEAVCDDDYLKNTLHVGNGSSGLKGFKRKAFLRAVTEYKEAEPVESPAPPTQNATTTGSMSTKGGMSSHFLPTNLFGDDDPNPVTLTNLSEPPEELVCPIGLVLMTDDPVLAADGVTYERVHIENWFRTKMAGIQTAQENLKRNPHSESDKRMVELGIVSPAHGTPMKHLNLSSNTSVRNMARSHKDAQTQLLSMGMSSASALN